MSIHYSTLSFFCCILSTRRPPISTLFPSRRSSDLYLGRRPGRDLTEVKDAEIVQTLLIALADAADALKIVRHAVTWRDRKSTRLNSSHRCISYAVFCLKKKKRIVAGKIIVTSTQTP